MKQRILFAQSLAGLLTLTFLSPPLSAQTWQYFQDPVLMPKYVPAVRVDAGGKLWYSSSSILGSYDGSSWQAHDFQAAGISVPYNSMRTIAAAPDGKIWCSSFDRVLEFDPTDDSWILHNPSNASNNPNGFGITVAPDGLVYWTDGGGWYEWDGNAWVRHYFWIPNPQGYGIEENSVRQFIIDPFGEPWFLTSGSIGIETGIIIPAGIIHKTSTDTIVYKMGDMGYPDLLTPIGTANNQGYPMVLVAFTDAQGRKLRLLSYEFGGWQNVGESPVTMASVNEIARDPIGNIWLAGNIDFTQPVVLRRRTDGSWETYLLDPQEISYIYSIDVGPDGRVWVGGKNENNSNQGVVAMLPPQPISATSELPSDRGKMAVAQQNGLLEFYNLPAHESLHVTAFDAQGRVAAALHLSGGVSTISTTQWPNGMYFLNIQSQGTCPVQTIKFVKSE